SLAGVGRYREALALFREAAETGEKYRIHTLAVRALAMSAGYRLDLYDFEGARAIAERALEAARSLAFAPTITSSLLGIAICRLQSGDTEGLDGLLAEVATVITKASGAHLWIWKARYEVLRAELACLRGERDAEDLVAATIDAQGRPRVKYRVAGL